jgi:glycosyltransferase involved in cell wall biosynthesis
MSTIPKKNEIIERLRWNRVARGVWEEALTAAGCGLPGARVQAAVRRQIAQGVYGCRESEVFLYKSGRAALRGLLEGLRTACPERRTAFVPDYVCNVVGGACRAAGFAVAEYSTDDRCQPDWPALEERVRRETAPVVVLCSLFGSLPALALEAAALEQANPRLFVVADECQNLVPDSPVKPRPNRAVVFSFNDKTCPGIMGGGIACSAESGVAPAFARAPFHRRLLCSVALAYRWFSGMLRRGLQTIRLAMGRGGRYAAPDVPEYSTCLRPHYDLAPEPICRLSAARARVSLQALDGFRRVRIENALALQAGLDLDPAAAQAGAPFLPVTAAPVAGRFPAPVKAAYGRTAHAAISGRPPAVRVNVPHVRYECRPAAIAQLTSRHAVTDNRILHCMARTADTYGYRSLILGPAAEDGAYGAIELKACPVLKEGHRPPHVCLLAHLFAGALRSGVRTFQIHDPDLLPVALLLKLFGRRIIYDVHDDYQASFQDRFRNRPWLRSWFPAVWWAFEKCAARAFDGVVTADQHLADKFTRCRPAILRNYPRLDFTPPAAAEGEETFNLVYVGGVSRERGVGMALEALRRLPIPELRLHLVGTCRESDLLADLQTEPRVVLHGRVAWTDLHRIYVKSHVGLALYQPRAGFVTIDHSVKIVEYMAAGLPILCADFPGLEKFVEEAGCGVVVRPDDPEAIAAQIHRLRDDVALRRRMGAKGRRLFESEYHWEKHEGTWVDLYKKGWGP